jgi:hypothetical protein
MVRLLARMSSSSGSPRIRSAPNYGLSRAICPMQAMVAVVSGEGRARCRFPPPEQPEALPVPAQHLCCSVILGAKRGAES